MPGKLAAARQGGFALVYHEVCPQEEVRGTGLGSSAVRWFIRPEDFRGHLRLLREYKYTIALVGDGHKLTADSNGFAYVTFDDGGISNYTGAYPILEEFNAKGHFFLITDLLGTTGYMTPEMVRELSSNGHHIGSHSRTHRYLKYLGDKEMRMELEYSKKYIENMVGKPCETLSMPGGLYSRKVIDAAFEVGYRNLFTSKPSLIGEVKESRTVMGRWSLENQRSDELSRLLEGEAKYIYNKKMRYALVQAFIMMAGPKMIGVGLAMTKKRNNNEI